jgi:Fe/S biogenesis protein NfuA
MGQTTETIVQLTPTAREHLLALRSRDPEGDHLAVRLAVAGVEGDRYRYDLAFRYIRDAGPEDVVQRDGALTLVVPRSSVGRLRGARIDFEGDAAHGSLAIENPNRPSVVGMMLPVVPRSGPGGDAARGSSHAGHAHGGHEQAGHVPASRSPDSSPAVGRQVVGELTGDLAQRVAQVLDGAINPAIAAHGGHAELVGVEGETAYLRLSGGCQGCGMATVTLYQGIQVAIMKALPEIRNVVDVTDHANGTNPYFQPAARSG